MSKTKCPMCGGDTVQMNESKHKPQVGEGEICDAHALHWRDYEAVESFCLNCPCRFVMLRGEDAPVRCEECKREQEEMLTFPIGGTC